jgi:cytochrome c oxidase subunit IV
MTGSVLGLGIAAIVALLIGEATLTVNDFQASPIWETLAFLPAIAIPLGFALLITLLIVTFRKRSQAAKDAGK